MRDEGPGDVCVPPYSYTNRFELTRWLRLWNRPADHPGVSSPARRSPGPRPPPTPAHPVMSGCHILAAPCRHRDILSILHVPAARDNLDLVTRRRAASDASWGSAPRDVKTGIEALSRRAESSQETKHPAIDDRRWKAASFGLLASGPGSGYVTRPLRHRRHPQLVPRGGACTSSG